MITRRYCPSIAGTDDHSDQPIYLSLPEAEVLFSDIMQDAATGGAEFIITIDKEPAIGLTNWTVYLRRQ